MYSYEAWMTLLSSLLDASPRGKAIDGLGIIIDMLRDIGNILELTDYGKYEG